MKIKEGGGMDAQEEREAFETWLFSTEKFKFRNKNFLFMLDEYGNYEDKPVLEHWETWQAAKAQAVPEGYVLMPIKPTETMVMAVVKEHEGDAFLPYSLYDAYVKQAMIELQEPAND
jgi:hypothetical protein